MSAHSPAELGAGTLGKQPVDEPRARATHGAQLSDRKIGLRTARRRAGQVALQIPMILMALSILFPLYFMVANSLKTRSAFAHSALDLPAHPTLAKYADAINSADLGRFFVNSAIISVVSVAIATACAALAAYAFAKMTFPGSEAIFRIMLPTMAVPPTS